jgi:hypothetical protein
MHSKREEAVKIISRILLEVNPPDATSSRPSQHQQTQAAFRPRSITPSHDLRPITVAPRYVKKQGVSVIGFEMSILGSKVWQSATKTRQCWGKIVIQGAKYW